MNTLHILLAIPAVWVKVIQFFIALSILIIIHEFGHYLMARLTKTRVNKFYLFFDFFFPFPSFMNFSIFKKKIGDTEYGLGWFPLGGYVSIAGMVDETSDKDALAGEPEPWEYRSKKSWQKLLIMLGGIIFNVILAVLIYIIIFAKYGESYLVPENATYGIHTDSLGRSIGLMDGDKIMKVGDRKLENINKAVYSLIFDEAKTITVERDGSDKIINVPEGTARQCLKIMKAKGKPLYSLRMPAVVDTVVPESPNKGLLQKGDKFLAVADEDARFIEDAYKQVKAAHNADSARASVPVRILRGKDTLSLDAKFNKEGKLGIGWLSTPDSFFNITHIEYPGLHSIPRGLAETKNKLQEYMLQLRLIFTSPEVKVSESLGGFGSIGGMFPGEFDLFMFLQLTAFISIILAFMNLLPIPGLDGGYVLFLLFEMITGIKMKDAWIEKANSVGLIILLALMLYANGLDVWRWFTGG